MCEALRFILNTINKIPSHPQSENKPKVGVKIAYSYGVPEDIRPAACEKEMLC